METKAEKRERIRKNQSKMVVRRGVLASYRIKINKANSK
jgi:hypothetical protein